MRVINGSLKFYFMCSFLFHFHSNNIIVYFEKSSKKSKKDVDEISRETQRLVKDSHVRLPYHKPKQKTLKDFLNRQKITTEFQASITGSKKLLQKAW